MVQNNTNRSVSSSDVDGLELLLGRRAPLAKSDVQPAANRPSPSDAQLLGYLQRSLAGEPFPVSAPRLRTPAEEAVPLALRIREILRTEQENERAAARHVEAVPTPTPAPAMARPTPPPPIAKQAPLPSTAKQAPLPQTVRPAATAPAAKAMPPQHSAPAAELPPSLPPLALPLIDSDLPPLAAVPRLARPAVGWGSAAFVLLIAVGGACLPGVLASPARYEAEARLQLLGIARTTPGFLEATTLRLTSPRLLSQVVARLKLDHDAEFSGGKATSYSVIMDLLNDSGAASDNFSRAQAALLQTLTVMPDRQGGMLNLAVQSADPKKSARIANLLADIAVRDAAAKPLASPPGEAELALEGSRSRYDTANAALAAFKTAAGDDKIAAATDLMQRKEALGNQIATATSAAQAASIRLAAAKAVKMADVLDGSISPDLGSPAPLEDLRNRYAAARSTLGQLSTQLGPRHPRLLAVQSTIETLGTAILAEIQKMVVASDAEVKTTAGQVKQLKDKLADLDHEAVDVDLVTFGQLQANAETARQAYETALTAAEEAKPSSPAAEVPLALAAPAVPPLAPIDDNQLGRALIGGLCGFAIGLALVACRRLFGRSLRNASFDEGIIDFDTVDLLADVPPAPVQAEVLRETPQQRFNAAIAVANDPLERPPEAAPQEPDTALTAIIGDVASLRAKVATYVSQRQAAGR